MVIKNSAILQVNVQEKIKKHQKRKERVLSALDYAYKHYMENLYNKDAKVAQDYIKSRKFTKNIPKNISGKNFHILKLFFSFNLI